MLPHVCEHAIVISLVIENEFRKRQRPRFSLFDKIACEIFSVRRKNFQFCSSARGQPVVHVSPLCVKTGWPLLDT